MYPRFSSMMSAMVTTDTISRSLGQQTAKYFNGILKVSVLSGCTFQTSRSSALQYLFLMDYEIVLSATNMSITLAVQPNEIAYNEVMDTAQLVIHSMLASRILFKLRESDKRAHELTLSLSHVSEFRAT
ncbi:hypothetical protein BV22DRAFT_731053 [Leucogyrophana mollusca]|uniref:Uncharacterized protein n=1 Tax=Leucogyrophana mollusca TaxID=85980 RepID=A0ACB8B8A4_9AGAM|nr:hypothetical protein BV22DRAFT_731053 [Leucogyrophana mollusca]